MKKLFCSLATLALLPLYAQAAPISDEHVTKDQLNNIVNTLVKALAPSGSGASVTNTNLAGTVTLDANNQYLAEVQIAPLKFHVKAYLVVNDDATINMKVVVPDNGDCNNLQVPFVEE